MAHPTRTGDLVVFSAPPYQFDAATPGTLIARSAFFGQHGYVPDMPRPAATPTCGRRSSPAARRSVAAHVADVRSIDLAPTAAFLLGVPVPQHSQGQVVLPLLKAAISTGRSTSSGSTTSTASSTRRRRCRTG